MKAVFTDASGLRAGGHIPVTVAGVPKGTVEDVRYERGRAVATLRMDGDVRGRVYRDARAEIAPRSALNDLTVDIEPGTPTRGPLASGARIPDTRTSGTVGTDRLIGVLDADTRTQVAVLFSQLRGALRGRTDEVAASVRRLPPLVDSSTRVASALAQRRVLLTKLVGETDTLLRTLGDRGRALSSAIAAGDRTLSVTSARQAELAAAVQALPGALSSLDRALAGVDELAPSLNPALDRLRPFAQTLPATLASVREFTPAGKALIAQLGELARTGREPTADLRRALVALQSAAPGLTPPVRKLLPTLQAIDKNKTGIGLLGDRFSGIFSTNDENGVILRGLGFFEPFDPEHFGLPGAKGARLASLKADVVRALTQVCLHDNEIACLARYLVPGLPGSVRSAAHPEGDARLSREHALKLLANPVAARRAGLTPRPRGRS